jgi:anti-sigma B factor antagonist
VSFGFSVDERNGIRVIRLRGELDLTTAYKLADGLSGLEGSAVVVDLSGLTFIDSSGISVLVREYNRRGELVLTRPQRNVARVLRIAGLADWVRSWRPIWGPDPADASGEEQEAAG